MKTARIDQLPYEAETVGPYDWIEVVVNGETFSRKAQAQALPYAQKNGDVTQWFSASGITATGGIQVGPNTPSVYFTSGMSSYCDWAFYTEGYKLLITAHFGSNWPQMFVLDPTTETASAFGDTIWTAGNHGSGSGLNADLLDGNHASAFAASGHTHSYLPLSGSTTLTGWLGTDQYFQAAQSVNCVGVWSPLGHGTFQEVWATVLHQTSDERLKQNIVSRAGSGLAAIRALPDGAIADFSFIASPDAVRTGFIAQQLAQAMPEAVSVMPGDPLAPEAASFEEIEGMSAAADPLLGVDLAAILALAVDAIRQLDAELADLRGRLDQAGL